MIELTHDSERDVTIFRGSGEVTVEDIKVRMSEFYSGQHTRHVLWDLTEADVSGISAEGVKSLAGLADTAHHGRSGGRTAIVVSREIAFGLSRMYQSNLDPSDNSVLTNVFRSLEEAEEFLGI